MDQTTPSAAVFVGIDVAKKQLDVHIRPGGTAFTVSRDGPGLDALVQRLQALPADLIVLEATGGFETVVTATLGGAGLPVLVVNPRQIRDFARACGQLAKTDGLDAAGHCSVCRARPAGAAAFAGRGHAPAWRIGGPAAADRRDDHGRGPQAAAGKPQAGAEAPGCAYRLAAEGTQQPRCRHRHGRPREPAVARARGLAGFGAGCGQDGWRARCWPSCRSWASWTGARWLLWSALRR